MRAINATLSVLCTCVVFGVFISYFVVLVACGSQNNSWKELHYVALLNLTADVFPFPLKT